MSESKVTIQARHRSRSIQALSMRSDGMTYRQIAEAIGVKPGNVRDLVSAGERYLDQDFRDLNTACQLAQEAKWRQPRAFVRIPADCAREALKKAEYWDLKRRKLEV